MELRPGYKQTDVGVIPVDWDVKRLGELGDCVIGLTYKPEDVAPHGALVLRSSNIVDATLRFENNVYVRIPIPEKLRVRNGDLLVCVRNGSRDLIGKCAAINESLEDVTFGAFMAVLRADAHAFIFQQFQFDIVKRQIREHLGATINQITNKSMRSFRVPFPSERQERDLIACALEDTDALAASLERLIVKKRHVKLAATQRLLAGRVRLPGFRDKWETRRVDEMGDVLAGKALDTDGHGPLRPYLRTKNVLDGRIDLEDVLLMPMTDAEFQRFQISVDDILLNEGQSLELVGRCSMYRGELAAPCAMQNQLLRFRAHNHASAAFAEHLFRYCQQSGVFSVIATQTTSVAHLGSVRFATLKLLWPPTIDEQRAIAEVLSDMDAEITALEARREKAKALKQAMMQELLTGRTRLV